MQLGGFPAAAMAPGLSNSCSDVQSEQWESKSCTYNKGNCCIQIAGSEQFARIPQVFCNELLKAAWRAVLLELTEGGLQAAIGSLPALVHI